MSALKGFLKDKGYCKIKLEKLTSNHRRLEASINGIKGSFILDTGASSSCIDFKDLDRFEVEVNDLSIRAAGAGDSNMQGSVSFGNKLKVGAWKTKEFNLVAIDLSHVNEALSQEGIKPTDGVMGADFLEQSGAIIDFEKNKLYLRRKIFKK